MPAQGGRWCFDRTPVIHTPAGTASGQVLAWDGRLDNADDLRMRLGVAGPGRESDAALVLRALERWGTDAFAFLVGDWSAAAWDPAQRRLHLARDFMGVRPLFYSSKDRSVTWSANLAELAIETGRDNDLSEAFVARYVTSQLSAEATPYRGIQGISPGTCVTFTDDGGESRRRFWRLEPGLVRYRAPHQYEEHLRSLWADALGARLRTPGVVWVELSGGLDSSSVVCMADALISTGRAVAAGIRPVSHVTLNTPEGDERRFIAEVERCIGVRSEIVGVEEHQDETDPDWDWVSPYALRGVGLAAARRIRAAGGSVLLSGRGGDLIMGGGPDNCAAVLDDVFEGRLLRALAQSRRWCRACRRPFIDLAFDLIRQIVRPDPSPRPARNALNSRASLLTPRLRELAMAIGERSTSSVAAAPVSKRRLAAGILGYSAQGRLNIPLLPPGIVCTYPFLHRPLIEFVLAIPGEQLSAPGVTRSLMRRAFSGLVPDAILRRTSKGYYPPAVVRSLRLAASTMLPVDDMESVRRQWLDRERLDAAVRSLVRGDHNAAMDIRRALHLETWLRARERRGPAAIPRRKEVNDDAVLNA